MQIIKEQIQNILREKGIESIQFNVPPKKELGDLSSAIALSLAKKESRSPIEIANELKELLNEKVDYIKEITISEPGYLNFFIDYTSFGKYITSKTIDSGTIFSSDLKKDKKISIEHTGVNPNKAMHIGHLRNSIIGDSIGRLYKALGYKTEIINYIDDTGIQVADIVAAFLYLEDPKYTNEDNLDFIWQKWNQEKSFDYFCWDLYAKFSEQVENSPELASKRKEVFTLIEKGNNPIASFAKEVALKIVESHIQTCSKVNISFDLLVWESDILANKFWEETFEILKDKQILVKEKEGPHAGCWVVKAGGVETKDDQEFFKDKILVKSDGTLTYTAKDLAYQMWKLGKLSNRFLYKNWGNTNIKTTASGGSEDNTFGNANQIINVIDYRQSYPQEIIKDILKKLGYLKNDKDYHHLAYGVVNLTEKAAETIGVYQSKDKVLMSGRKGIGIKADDLIQITTQEIDKKTKNKEISEKLAISAIRFYMTKFTTSQNINFDFDSALQTNGETGIYLSYAYARAINILKKANYSKTELNIKDVTQSEEKLINTIAEYETVFELAKNNMEIAEISKYAFTLCSSFAEFYEQKNAEPIYKTEDMDLKNWRLALVKSFSIILKDLFSILGIDPLEKI